MCDFYMFYAIEVVGHGSETQLQVGENWNWIISQVKGLYITSLNMIWNFKEHILQKFF